MGHQTTSAVEFSFDNYITIGLLIGPISLLASYGQPETWIQTKVWFHIQQYGHFHYTIGNALASNSLLEH